MLQFLIPLFTTTASRALKESLDNAITDGDTETIKELALKAEKPFFQSKRFLTLAITTIILMLNRKLGLDLGIEEITAITGLVSVYITSEVIKKRKS